LVAGVNRQTCNSARRGLKLRGQSGDDFDGFEADADDLTDEADDVLFVIRAVGIGLDAADGLHNRSRDTESS
jgi:hypothetical protein